MQRQPPTTRSDVSQAAKGVEQTGRALGRLTGRGLSYVGRKLSALETEGGPRRLPVIPHAEVVRGLSMPGQKVTWVKTGDYFLDERLRELRSIDNPYNVIRLNDVQVEYFKGLVDARSPRRRN